MSAYVLSHDVGTSSVKSALVRSDGVVIAHRTAPYSFEYPQAGWVEQNPDDYWDGIVKNTRQIVDENQEVVKELCGIVFSTQAMGIIPIDREGKRLYTNITWVDGRAEEEAQWLMRLLGGKRLFNSLIGVELTGKDVIAKLRWLKHKKPEVYNNTDKILDVNGWLKYKATGMKVAEWSGACSYGFNLKKKDWERLLFKVSGLDLEKFPSLVRSTDNVGNLTDKAAAEMGLPVKIPVFGGCDDTQSAAMGSGAAKEGDAHIYLGTSAWAGITTIKNLKHKNGAAVLQSADPGCNLIVGITESAGSNLEWLIDNFYKHEKNDPTISNIFDFINEETELVPQGSEHLIFTPWLLGERCPVSSTTTRGTLFNIGLEHSRAHMVNALLEGIGYNLKWIFENFERDFKYSVHHIRAIGGGSTNEKWMQDIANITGKWVETITEPTMAGTIGAAACAFVGSGVYKSFLELDELIKVDKVFEPAEKSRQIFDELFQSYKELYHDLKDVYDRLNRKRLNK